MLFPWCFYWQPGNAVKRNIELKNREGIQEFMPASCSWELKAGLMVLGILSAVKVWAQGGRKTENFTMLKKGITTPDSAV